MGVERSLYDLILEEASEIRSKELDAYWKNFTNSVANGIGKAFG